MDKFLRDGGIALRNGEVRLPRNVMLTLEQYRVSTSPNIYQGRC
jgi:hypothetical protein